MAAEKSQNMFQDIFIIISETKQRSRGLRVTTKVQLVGYSNYLASVLYDAGQLGFE
jgi:hypothetical protein